MAKRKPTASPKITHADVRMYCMGTGDCFIIKFFAGNTPVFTMMIDCGTWEGTQAELTRYIDAVKEYTEGKIDVLVVTHEHKDHVYGFGVCKELFLHDFTIKHVWMGWTEDDASSGTGETFGDEVQQWKQDYGQRKKALGLAADEFARLSSLQEQRGKAPNAPADDKAFQMHFAEVLGQFADLHFSARGGEYVGDLEGMRVVKKDLAPGRITYYKPGDIIENLENAEGLRFYVLGPPSTIEAVKKESGPAGETFEHSRNNRSENTAFLTALLNLGQHQPASRLLPFDERFVSEHNPGNYDSTDWRNIEYNWLLSAGSLALRMNSATNNLSLALAIEFVDSGKVMLFPGDAEYGSWSSWHEINWVGRNSSQKHFTEDLLNRTVFYKVAHHLSHNGTAKKRGVEMMTHQDLVAMATLDYGRISNGWKSTMPNRYLLQDLINRTKGRLIVMNEENLFVETAQQKIPLKIAIENAREKFLNAKEAAAFVNSFEKDSNRIYTQFRVNS